MPINLLGRSFLSLNDFSSREIDYLLDLAVNLKRKKQEGIKGDLLDGKNVVLLFEKESTLIRCAFEVAAYDEGANITFLSRNHSGTSESIEDMAKVLGRYYDGIEFLGTAQETAELFAKYAGVPVWNGLADACRSAQILADFLTVREHIRKPFSEVKLVYVGDMRNNIGSALMIGCAKMGMRFVGLAPKVFFPGKERLQQALEVAKETGAKIEFFQTIEEAVADADVIYTDAWMIAGEEAQLEEKIRLLKPYQITLSMMKKTKNKDAIFLHSLPAFHDRETRVGEEMYKKYKLSAMEVTDEVFRSSASKVFDQAENRLHAIKAVLVATIGKI